MPDAAPAPRTLRTTAALLCFAAILSGCVSHLQEAKTHYAQAEDFIRSYREGLAQAAYLKAREEAALEIRRNPSAQAYLLKGMAELGLRRWQTAAASFRHAFTLGFEKGEEWAEDLALYGIALSFLETGMDSGAEGLLKRLVSKSRSKPVARLAARSYAERILARALDCEERERTRLLEGLLSAVDKLIDKDPACGYHRYLASQVHGHLGNLRLGFESAVMARELGLPGLELLHDNDNQIIFLQRRLRDSLDARERASFESRYLKWTERWGWPDPETPSWRKR